MRLSDLLILITFSFFAFGCSNSDSNKETVKNQKVAEEKTSQEIKEITVYNDENLKTIEGIKNYLQGGWSLEKRDTTLFYYFVEDNLIHYIVASEEQTEKYKDNEQFIKKSKQFSKARESKVIYNQNGIITSVKSNNSKSNITIKVIDENSFVVDSDEDKPIFKRSNIDKPIVGEIYQKLDWLFFEGV